MRAKLIAMALNGDSIVNPLGATLDDVRTPQGRARKEREEQHRRTYERALAQLEERRDAFQWELDRLDHASLMALQENEDQQRKARYDLRCIQEHAYEIAMPDGSLARVYRDGDTIRTEAGSPLDPNVLKPSDLPAKSPTWADYVAARSSVAELERKHKEIVDYREAIEEVRKGRPTEELSLEEIDKLENRLKVTAPQLVSKQDELLSRPAAPKAAAVTEPQAAKDLVKPFERAASGSGAMPMLADGDFDLLQKIPTASTPAPR